MKNIRGLIPLLFALLLTGCGCGDNDETIQKIRALPKERLGSLYSYVQKTDASRTGAGPIRMFFPEDPVPQEIADLDPQHLQVWGDQSRIHLSGCVDDKIDLFFSGLSNSSGKKEIILTLGERNGTETVWEQ
jgi:hypothetical protein